MCMELCICSSSTSLTLLKNYSLDKKKKIILCSVALVLLITESLRKQHFSGDSLTASIENRSGKTTT